jgi:glycosyltransferase involved in cell wall biosynthesis
MEEVQYLTFDSLKEGVGASQVLAYMREVAKVRPVQVISFEKIEPSEVEIRSLVKSGISWTPLPFNEFGILGGLSRVVRMALLVDRSKIIHARSTLPALSGLLRFSPRLIWDCRSLQADQRRALSGGSYFAPSFLFMRILEGLIARKSKRVIVITKSVMNIVIKRHKISNSKLVFIPTCVDTHRFTYIKSKNQDQIRILLSGTFSAAYDYRLINKIILNLRKRTTVEVIAAISPGSTSNWEKIEIDGVTSKSHLEMPNLIKEFDLGVSLWRNDLGVCLTSVASTKTAEFLASGRPVLINSNQGDLGAIIAKYGIGVVTDGDSELEIESYCDEILRLTRDPKLFERCQKMINEEEYSLESGISKLLSIYRELDFNGN